jgi:hypothetical protein
MARVSYPLILLAASLGSASVGCSAEGLPPEEVGQSELEVKVASGKFLFNNETFQGNGRTCETCHSKKTGTVSPADAQQRLYQDPADLLFLHDGSDDGTGNGTSRMTQYATIRVGIELPSNVTIAGDPQAGSVFLRRGIPTTTNTPALDPVLMLDGRASDLETQANNAIHGHAQSGREPTGEDMRTSSSSARSPTKQGRYCSVHEAPLASTWSPRWRGPGSQAGTRRAPSSRWRSISPGARSCREDVSEPSLMPHAEPPDQR